MSIYDRVMQHIDDGKPEGITPLDIADLPGLQHKVMLTLLREQVSATRGITEEELRQKIGVPAEELNNILAELTKNGWLIQLGEVPDIHFKVNFKRKRGRSVGFGLWSLLIDRTQGGDSSTKDTSTAEDDTPQK
jgi:hypothetical protein